MNKAKINDLYEQAHVVYEIPYEASVVEPGHIAIHKQKVWDRYLFAELIVRECVSVGEDVANADGKGPWFEGYVSGVEEVTRRIKQHFGV